jgi:pyridoxine 5-phosphate synthase
VPVNLSVNLNKVALLRNSRGHDNPSPRVAAHACLDAGAAGLTLHWRADERHTREADVRDLRAICRERGVEFNLEGDERPALHALAEELRVDQFTLVPVRPARSRATTAGTCRGRPRRSRRSSARLNDRGVRTAIFMDPDPAQMVHAAATGCARVELYTEPYAAAWGDAAAGRRARRLVACGPARSPRRASASTPATISISTTCRPSRARARAGRGVDRPRAPGRRAVPRAWPRPSRATSRACRGVDVAAPVTR